MPRVKIVRKFKISQSTVSKIVKNMKKKHGWMIQRVW